MTEITVLDVGCGASRSLDAQTIAPDEIHDTRFRDLLGPVAWSRLPPIVQRRFSVALEPGERRIFEGEVAETTLTLAGRLISQLARIAGAPLPTTHGATGPAVVVVTEDTALGGQIWTRTYARPGRFPQTINSVKRFSGPTGLEEYLGFGLIMRLHIACERGDLVFRSVGYDVEVLGRRFQIARWLTPGMCTITHRALGGDRFAFTLELAHPWLGPLVKQVAVFKEVAS